MQYMGINENRFRFLGIAMVLVAVTVVFLVEQVIQPSYWIKSAVKVLAFSAPVVLYSFLRGISLTETINLRKISGPAPIVFCMLLFSVGVVALFFIFRDNLDLDGIRQNLMRKENLFPENCLYVFAYIILCNSFLEEAFFRVSLPHRHIHYLVQSSNIYSLRGGTGRSRSVFTVDFGKISQHRRKLRCTCIGKSLHKPYRSTFNFRNYR